MGQADGPGEGDGETRDGSRLCAAVLPTRRPSTMAVHPEPPCEQSAPVPDFSPVPRAGFNGAVASQPRKVDVGAGLGAVAEASLGPWLRSHGRRQPDRRHHARIAQLQWGRGFAATEGRRRRSMRRSCVASMGPWLRSHGRTPKQKAWPASQPGFNGAVASQPRKGTT